MFLFLVKYLSPNQWVLRPPQAWRYGLSIYLSVGSIPSLPTIALTVACSLFPVALNKPENIISSSAY